MTCTSQTMNSLIPGFMFEAKQTAWGKLLIECGFEIEATGDGGTGWVRQNNLYIRFVIANEHGDWHGPEANERWRVWAGDFFSDHRGLLAQLMPTVELAVLQAAHHEMMISLYNDNKRSALEQLQRVIGAIRKRWDINSPEGGDLLYTDAAVTKALKTMGEVA